MGVMVMTFEFWLDFPTLNLQGRLRPYHIKNISKDRPHKDNGA